MTGSPEKLALKDQGAKKPAEAGFERKAAAAKRSKLGF